MSQINVIPQQKIDAAVKGDQQAMREILKGLANTTGLQTTVTNTGGKNVPMQGKASVSFLNSTYIVQIQNPGAVSPTSALQAAQAGAAATLNTNVAPVTPIYYQIRVGTSPAFSISSNVQVFGGDTGSTQTYWELSGLGSGRFYFQIRSSYDGVNWNLWRNANGGQTITPGISGVTTEQRNNALWAAFTLPGGELCAFGAGFVADGGSFDVAENLYTSAMLAIPGPNGFTQTGNLSHGIRQNAIAIATPTVPQGLTGPADYPTVVGEKYEDGEGHIWSGDANIFGFAFDPLGTNVVLYSTPQGVWAVFTLPGGAQMAVGAGVVPNGTALVPPTAAQGSVPVNSAGRVPPGGLDWIAGSDLLGIVTPNNAFSSGNHAHGVNQSGFTGLTVTATFEDGEGHIWGGTVNWFAVAFSPGINFETVTGGKFAVFDLPGGTKVGIGNWSVPSGTSFGLPVGFSAENTVSIAVPAGLNDTGHAMSGVARCDVVGTLANLAYQDGAANFWTGQVAGFTFCWIP